MKWFTDSGHPSPQHDAIVLYTRQGAPQRPGSEVLLGWLREVLSDEQIAEAIGLALGARCSG